MRLSTIHRIKRHIEITRANRARELRSPPFLILFINSICNMHCEHCFYWRQLNQRTDLTRNELFDLSSSLGQIDSLSVSGGEPFLRKEFAEIVRQFIAHNGVRQVYVPTNGWYTRKTIEHVTNVLEEKALDLFAVELSLEGTEEFHDRFRVAPGAFKRAMETYDSLVELQRKDPRLRVHSTSTATAVNIDEIRKLTTYLYERCPHMDHHNLALIRGDRKNPSLTGPGMEEYKALYEYIRHLWAPREKSRYGGIVEPMLQWAKIKTVRAQRQVVPCRAGRLSAVVYANGDISLCEMHTPIGNLRRNTFWEIYTSAEANALREQIDNKGCYCTTEVFMWPSIVFQPLSLVRAMIGGRVWAKPKTLGEHEKLKVPTPR
ncbi:MAG: radical SAM protein [Gemmatimonadales bacterium]|nr:radical SAM protein [Gemmatimonadales bacterium]